MNSSANHEKIKNTSGIIRQYLRLATLHKYMYVTSGFSRYMYQIGMTGSVAPITTNKMKDPLHNKPQSPRDLDNPALCNGLQSVDRFIGNTMYTPVTKDEPEICRQ